MNLRLMLIPCLVAVMILSSFEKAAAFTDVYTQTTIVPAWTDLDGVEYIDFYVEIFDENYGQVYVTDLSFNYSVYIQSNSWYREYTAGPFTGYGPFLLEAYGLYHIPGPTGGLWVQYGLVPGTGYII